MIFQPLLFGLIGAEVDISNVKEATICKPHTSLITLPFKLLLFRYKVVSVAVELGIICHIISVSIHWCKLGVDL